MSAEATEARTPAVQTLRGQAGGVTAQDVSAKVDVGQPTLSTELAQCLPTPVSRFELAGTTTELWLKDDGLTGISYGGNKLRKLAPLIAYAVGRGKRRIVTVGAAGSHHVLATTLFASRVGLRTAALVFPQPATPHVESNLRAAMALGLEIMPVASSRDCAALAARLFTTKDAWLGPGGMGVRGASGFADAVFELSAQIARGECPAPDAIVLPVGSGSSAAGLLVGAWQCGLDVRVVGVTVNANPAVRPMVLAQAWALLRSRLPSADRKRAFLQLSASLSLETGYAGRGYGVPSTESARAIQLAQRQGLLLEHTYTGKAFAAALSLAHSGGFRRILFWNTVSSASLDSVLLDAPPVSALPKRVQALLQPMNLEV